MSLDLGTRMRLVPNRSQDPRTPAGSGDERSAAPIRIDDAGIGETDIDHLLATAAGVDCEEVVAAQVRIAAVAHEEDSIALGGVDRVVVVVRVPARGDPFDLAAV